MRSSRIIHVVDGTGERERLEVLDGSPREFIRHNETQLCLIPEKNLVFPACFWATPTRFLNIMSCLSVRQTSRVLPGASVR